MNMEKEMESEKMEKKEVGMKEIREYVNLWRKYDKSYFWSPCDLSFQRRKAEEDNSFDFEFYFNGHHYVMSIRMQQSTRNVYVRRELKKDGVRVSIRALTKYVKGTDDDPVAGVETSVKDVCRPETGK